MSGIAPRWPRVLSPVNSNAWGAASNDSSPILDREENRIAFFRSHSLTLTNEKSFANVCNQSPRKPCVLSRHSPRTEIDGVKVDDTCLSHNGKLQYRFGSEEMVASDAGARVLGLPKIP